MNSMKYWFATLGVLAGGGLGYAQDAPAPAPPPVAPVAVVPAPPAAPATPVSPNPPADAPAKLGVHPGIVAVDAIPALSRVQPDVETFLNKPLLEMLAATAQNLDPDMRALLAKVDTVHVLVYQRIEDSEALTQALNGLTNKLKGAGWIQTVSIPANGMRILTQVQEQVFKGILILIGDGNGFVFVNVAGDVLPSDLKGRFGSLASGLFSGNLPIAGLSEIFGPGMISSGAQSARKETSPAARVLQGLSDTLGNADAQTATHGEQLLADAFKSPEQDARWEAAKGMAALPNPSEGAIAALISALQDKDSDVRERVVASIAEIGRKHKDKLSEAVRTRMLAALEGVLNDPTEENQTREDATRALSAFGKQGVPRLLAIWNDKSHRLRWEAAQALGMTGPDAAEALPALMEELRTGKEEGLKRQASVAIQKIGMAQVDPKTAETMIEELTATVDNSQLDSQIREDAARSLGNFGEAAIPNLLQIARNREHTVRWEAIEGLGLMGLRGKTAVPPLIELLKDANTSYQRRIVTSLGQIGDFSQKVALSPDEQAQWASLRKQIVAAVVPMLDSFDPRLRTAAQDALRRQGPEAANALVERGKNLNGAARFGGRDTNSFFSTWQRTENRPAPQP